LTSVSPRKDVKISDRELAPARPNQPVTVSESDFEYAIKPLRLFNVP
jgi:hypothetical protein